MNSTKKGTIIILLLAAALTGCKKENTTGEKPANSPGSIMLNYFRSAQEADFTVLMSSALGFSLYEPSYVDESNSGLQGYSKYKTNVGVLSVNGKNIPFENRTYFHQIDIDSTITTSMFTGVMNEYVFKTTSPEQVPSFNVSKYSPAVPLMSYEGMKDKSVDRQAGFRMNWTPDPKIPGEYAKGLVIIAGEREDMPIGFEPELIYFIVDDNLGGYTITGDDLNKFSEYPRIAVYYARGYSVTETINNKKVDFQFLTFSWLRAYFKE